MTGVTYAETRKTLADAHKHDITCNSFYMSTGMYRKKTAIIRKEGISIYHIEGQNSVGAPAPNLSKAIHTTPSRSLYTEYEGGGTEGTRPEIRLGNVHLVNLWMTRSTKRSISNRAPAAG